MKFPISLHQNQLGSVKLMFFAIITCEMASHSCFNLHLSYYSMKFTMSYVVIGHLEVLFWNLSINILYIFSVHFFPYWFVVVLDTTPLPDTFFTSIFSQIVVYILTLWYLFFWEKLLHFRKSNLFIIFLWLALHTHCWSNSILTQHDKCIILYFLKF